MISFVFFICIFDISLAANCSPDAEGNFKIWKALDDCMSDAKLVNWSNALIASWWGFSEKIRIWVTNISLFLWLMAVLSIVIWSLMMTFSWWEDEKVKKWKDVVKWWIIWFIWLMSVSGIVNLIVKIMYSI